MFESFEHETTLRCEKFLISHFKTEASKGWGANKNPGGAGQRAGVPKSLEHRQKLSEANKGKHDHRGSKHPSWGKKRSPEQRANISSSLQGKMCGEKNPRWGANVSDNTRQRISAGLRSSPLNRGEKSNLSKLTTTQVIEVKTSFNEFPTIKSACIFYAAKFGVTDLTVLGIIKGKTWLHVTVPEVQV
jgi:hypothetical protein